MLTNVQGGSNMTGTNCDLFTHKSSRSYLNHLVSYVLTQTILFYTAFYYLIVIILYYRITHCYIAM